MSWFFVTTSDWQERRLCRTEVLILDSLKGFGNFDPSMMQPQVGYSASSIGGRSFSAVGIRPQSAVPATSDFVTIHRGFCVP